MGYTLDKTGIQANDAINEQYDGDPCVKVGWDDLVGSLIARRLESTSGKLQYNYTENSITMESSGSIGNNTDRLIFNFQKPHGMSDNETMNLHVHWEQVTTNKIEFTLQYRVQSNNAVKNTTWTTVIRNSDDNSAFTYPGSGTFNQITKLAEIDLSSASISSTIQFRLARTDSTSGDIEATFVDAHIPYDQDRGSRQEYIK
ncbi:MAG: hypothetical protein ACTSP4_00920 [Candidatus Hodarchaeales archaeon]